MSEYYVIFDLGDETYLTPDPGDWRTESSHADRFPTLEAARDRIDEVDCDEIMRDRLVILDPEGRAMHHYPVGDESEVQEYLVVWDHDMYEVDAKNDEDALRQAVRHIIADGGFCGVEEAMAQGALRIHRLSGLVDLDSTVISDEVRQCEDERRRMYDTARLKSAEAQEAHDFREFKRLCQKYGGIRPLKPDEKIVSGDFYFDGPKMVPVSYEIGRTVNDSQLHHQTLKQDYRLVTEFWRKLEPAEVDVDE